MRALIQTILSEVDPTVWPPERIYQGSNVDDQPEFPFIVHRYRITDASASGRGRNGLEVWFYDAPGSYLRIDKALKDFRNYLVAVTDRRASSEHIAQIEWTGDSPDLPAEEYGGITRSGSFNLIGGSS
jgi:hypothetical protein